MNTSEYYSKIPHDLSGSRSKNRFRVELLWGVCKMLDLMECDKKFAVVFDYACDVEVHYEESLEFYQIKTHGTNTTSYTCKSLTKKKTDNAEGSILGKLYKLNIDGDKNIKLALVSNTAYKCDGKKLTDEVKCFDSLPKEEKDKIEEALKKELNLSNVDLSNVFYLHTDINLRNPEYEVQGKIVVSFERLKKCEPLNPRALFRLIVDTVTERACYEFNEEEYLALIQKKGITKEEFNEMLDCHAVNAKTGIKSTQEYIDAMPNISERHTYKKALAKIMQVIPSNRQLKELEKEIANFLLNQSNLGSIESAVDKLTLIFNDSFPIEYSNAEKVVFYFIVIFKFEEGVYDDEDDI